MRLKMMLALASLCAAPAAAEVRQSGPGFFELESRVVVAAAPDRAYAALGEIGRWWDPEHTYSGDAANLAIALRAGACFCETIPADGGSIEHGRVVYARPGQALRLVGSLGPLQSEAVVGTLTWALRPVENGTEITQTYVVAGHVRGGAERFAAPVDQVMSIQAERLRAYLEARPR